jgi:hypothetical protein
MLSRQASAATTVRAMEDLESDVARWAALCAELVANAERRDEIFARHGLDEARHQRLDDLWQSRLSAALDDDLSDHAGLLGAYQTAFSRALTDALARRAEAPMTLEKLALALSILGRGGDVRAALAAQGISLADIGRAQAHWAPKLATDPEAAMRFAALVGKRAGGGK